MLTILKLRSISYIFEYTQWETQKTLTLFQLLAQLQLCSGSFYLQLGPWLFTGRSLLLISIWWVRGLKKGIARAVTQTIFLQCRTILSLKMNKLIFSTTDRDTKNYSKYHIQGRTYCLLSFFWRFLAIPFPFNIHTDKKQLKIQIK